MSQRSLKIRGCGASCIYPLLGVAIFNYSFRGSDINEEAVLSAREIVRRNELKGRIRIKLNKTPGTIFRKVIKKRHFYGFTMCNPPFFSYSEEREP